MPSCALTGVGTNAQGQKYVQVTVQDAQGGLRTVTVTTLQNSIAQVGHYQSGIVAVPWTVQIPDHTTGPVIITATKIDQTKAGQLALRVTDLAGNVTSCDPILATVGRESGVPRRETFHHVGRAESLVLIHNDTPGLTRLLVIVNGRQFEVTDLHDGEERAVDVARAMRRGDNTITLVAQGKANGSATVLIADALPAKP